jgi:hypothetical protein
MKPAAKIGAHRQNSKMDEQPQTRTSPWDLKNDVQESNTGGAGDTSARHEQKMKTEPKTPGKQGARTQRNGDRARDVLTDERESDQAAHSLENGQENPNHASRKSVESLAPAH